MPDEKKERKYVYIDYENVADIKELIGIEGKYFFFIGHSQKMIPREIVTCSNNTSIEWITCTNGLNAMDFYIAYYIGMHSGDEDVVHYILSRDKGYDSLIASVAMSSHPVRIHRVTCLDEILRGSDLLPYVETHENLDKSPPEISKGGKELIERLGNQKQGLPKKKESLISYCKAAMKVDNNGAKKIVSELMSGKYIEEDSKDKLIYRGIGR